MDRKKILYSLFFLLLAAILLLMPAAFASAATTVGNNVSVGGTLAVTGVVTITADLDPSANNTVDIGAFGTAYNNLFVSSTASLNYVSSTSADLSDYLIVVGDLNVGSGTLFVDVSTNRVGINTSTPSAIFSIGTINTSSTVDVPQLCIRTTVDIGGTDTEMYMWPCSGASCPTVATAASGWATSTVSCF